MKRFVSVWLTRFAMQRYMKAHGVAAVQSPGRQLHCEPPHAARYQCGTQVVRSPGHPLQTRKKMPAFALAMPGPRGVTITALNQQARRAGIQVGQTVADARAIHPALLTRPAEPEADTAALKRIAGWAGRYGPNRNIDGPDGLWIEISGVAHLFGSEQALAHDLVERLARAGFTAHIGVAETVGAAHALARYGCGSGRPVAISPDGTLDQYLGRLPVDALRLSEDGILLLKRLGLRRIAHVAAMPRAALARRFREDARGGRRSDREAAARALVWRLDQVYGRVAEPRTPLEPPPIRRTACAFEEPLISPGGIEAALAEVATGLAQALRDAGEGARALRLSLYRADSSRAVVDAGASAPSNDGAHIASLWHQRLETVDAGMGIDMVALEATRVGPVAMYQSALSATGSARDHDAAAQLVDRLASRLGRAQVSRIVPEGSHIPERAERRLSALSTDARKCSGRSVGKHCKSPNRKVRPPFLLRNPEPIAVVAELPEGAPVSFRWRHVACRVTRSDGPERIAPEWWRTLECVRR